jgi:senataxin
LFLRLQKAGHAVTMLETQYRMHPLIASYPSQRFYSNRLITAASVLTSPSHQKPYHNDSSGRFLPFLFHDLLYSNEEPDSISIRNRDEAKYVLYLYDELIHRYPEYRGNVGIIAPYRAQRRYLTSLFRSKYANHSGVKKEGGGGGSSSGNDVMNDVEISTVDGFQGREKDIIIFSCVRSHPRGTSGASAIGFLKEWQRLNVAITRAKYALWIVGNSPTLKKDIEWNELIQFMRKHKAAVTFGSEKATKFPSVGSSSSASSSSSHHNQSKHQQQGSSSSSSSKKHHQRSKHQHHYHGSGNSNSKSNSSSHGSRSGNGGLRS